MSEIGQTTVLYTIMGSYYMGEVCSNGFTARKL